MTNLNHIRQQVKSAAQKGIAEGVLAVQSAAISYTPKAQGGGYLRASSRVTPVVMGVSDISVALVYDAIYARYQHENYGANFTTPSIGAAPAAIPPIAPSCEANPPSCPDAAASP